MDSKKLKQLEEAKALFYSLRLVEAYSIFRRFFDRLPFQPEPEHAEYIGMFVRILLELGKDYELKFYLSELERIYDRIKGPDICFQLAVVYLHLPEPRTDAAKKMIDAVLRDPQATSHHPKAKLLLVLCYNRVSDYDACRALLNSLGTVADPAVARLVEIWNAKILFNEGDLGAAEKILVELLPNLSGAADWYPRTSALVILAEILVKRQKIDEARKIRTELRKLFEGKHFRSVELQLNSLEETLKKNSELEALRLVVRDGESSVVYSDKEVSMRGRGTTKKLLLLLARKKFLSKANIVKNLYDRHYDSENDDKLIYYQIHALRKCLKSVGLPSDAVVNENDGYRLVPDVDFSEGELWAGELVKSAIG